MTPDSPLTCVSLFSGAGGLDVGLEQAGFHTVVATDYDADCVETLRANHSLRIPVNGSLQRAHLDGSAIIHADVADLTRADLAPPGATADWRPTLLAGGPPCQPFSSAGRQRGLEDPRGRLFEHFVRIASELQPDFILFENVRGLATARGVTGTPGEVLQAVKLSFEQVGYRTRFALLNSADYGAPQRRVRLFMLAARTGPVPQFPVATHSRKPAAGQCEPWTTLGEFLSERPEPRLDEMVRPSAALADALRDVPSGSGLKSPGRAEPTRPGGHWGYKQGTFIAELGLPARTVTAASTQDWVRLPGQELRRLTLSECAGLQGFPAPWTFAGNRASVFRQVGNAVPAVFGEVLGRCLSKAEEVLVTEAEADLPASIRAAIAYTLRDDQRNGHVRPRSPRYGDALAVAG